MMNKKLLYLFLMFFPLAGMVSCENDEIESWATAGEVQPYTGVYKGKMTTYIEDMETSRIWQQVKVETLGDTIALTMEEFRVKDIYFGDIVLKNVQAKQEGEGMSFHTIANLPLNSTTKMNVEVQGLITGGRLNISYAITSIRTPSVYGVMEADRRDQVESDSAAIVSMTFKEGLVLVQPEIDQEYKIIRFFVADTLSDSTRVILHPEFELFNRGTSPVQSGDSVDFTSGRVKITVWAEDSIHRNDYYVYMSKVRSYPTNFETWMVRPLNEPDTTAWRYVYLEPYNWVTSNEWIRWAKKNGYYAEDGLYPVDRAGKDKAKTGAYAARIRTLAVNGNESIPYLHGGILFMGNYSVNAEDFSLSAGYGETFDTRPVNVTGYYQYRPGEAFYNNNVVVEGGKDTCCVKAVLFEVANMSETLNYKELDTDPRIIATGIFQTPEEATEYTAFTLKLIYTREFISTRKYKLAVAFYSSKHGEELLGAPGSVLLVDDVNIVGH